MSPSQIRGYAAPIVILSSTSESYELNRNELEAVLKHKEIVDKKIVLVSISGAFRKGKSFMLNLFVAYLEWLTNGQEDEWLHKNIPMDKFHYRGGSKPDTNGITMWSKPYLLKGSDGKEYAVFLMDTQGTFDHNSTVKDCASIFAMSTLLSSVQIFNLDKQIQGDDLNNLRLFTEFAQLVKKGSETPLQKLLFLIRDWANSGEHEFGLKGGHEYLRKTLQIRDNEPKENRVIRENLQKSFQSLEAFLMPYPGGQVANNNSKTILGKVDEEFHTALEGLVPYLFKSENLVGKKINGHYVTCGELAELFRTYMEIFSGGELPEPKSILEATAEAVNHAAEQAARDEYDETMSKSMKKHENLCDLKILEKLQKSAEETALKRFEERPKIGEHSGEKNGKVLQKHFKARYSQFKNTVEKNIKVEEDKRKAEEERKRLKAEQQAEEKKQAAMKAAIEMQQKKQRDLEKKQQEEIRRQEKERERKTKEMEEAMARQKEEERKREEEQRIALEKQAKEALEREMRLRLERERQAKEAERMQLELEREREKQKKRLEEEWRVRNPQIIGNFCEHFSTYEVIANLEVHNRSRYHLQYSSIDMHRGVVSSSPQDIGPNVILRCGFHKTEFSWWGCGGTICWDYNIIGNKKTGNFSRIKLYFDTIWKSAIYQHPNTVAVTLITKNQGTKHSSGRNPTIVANQLISVTATTGDTNHTTIRVSITDAKD